jgi:hypothetical protein
MRLEFNPPTMRRANPQGHAEFPRPVIGEIDQ